MIRAFTGQTQDVIAGPQGIYDFLFRQQSPAEGRWLVPDPAGVAAVDPTNPQTWNRYAYVGNNPLNRVDPLGPDGQCDDQGNCTVTVNGNKSGQGGQSSNYYPGGWWDLAFEGWPGTGSIQSFFCMVMGGCTTSTQNQGGGATAVSSPAKSNSVVKGPAKPPVQNCVQATALQGVVIKGLSAASGFLNKTVGVGAGGSAGAGHWFGAAGTASR